MVNSTEFAKRLQKILEFYGLSATAFSEKIDFNRSTISHLLSGRNKPSLEFVMKVLNQFPEVELYWLLNGTGNFPSTATKRRQFVSGKFSPQTEWVDAPPLAGASSETSLAGDKTIEFPKNASEIERIVLFYKDGSFKVYQ